MVAIYKLKFGAERTLKNGEKEGKETLEEERVRGDCVKLINIHYSNIDVNIYACIYQMWYVKQHRSRLGRACLPGLRLAGSTRTSLLSHPDRPDTRCIAIETRGIILTANNRLYKATG